MISTNFPESVPLNSIRDEHARERRGRNDFGNDAQIIYEVLASMSSMNCNATYIHKGMILGKRRRTPETVLVSIMTIGYDVKQLLPTWYHFGGSAMANVLQ